jgi:hypothetical protein
MLMAEPTVPAWNILGSELAPSQAAPDDGQRWDFDGGFALVYPANGSSGIARPVIFADGFNTGPSEPDKMWAHMQGEGEDKTQEGYQLASALRERGHDLILLGYNERSARIQDNAQVAIDCITKANDEKTGDTPLAVGGFSMGGLVTRYALLKMDAEERPHRTSVYFSWDSPHRGAWVPISLQALAHYVKDEDGIADMSNYVNSPAARQLLRWQIETVDGDPGPDQLREDLLSELNELGDWPSVRLLGLASGSGQGTKLPIPAGAEMLKVTGLFHPYRTTTLYAQASGDDQLVAYLKRHRLEANPAVEKRTSGFPELDAAAGGILRSFGIAREALARLGAVESQHEWVDFVPTVSAVAIRDIDQQDALDTPVDSLPPGDSDLNEFICASINQEHSRVTSELAQWLLDRLPE